MNSGRSQSISYSLSRWTDVPAAKWVWFQQQLAQGWMYAFDPRVSLPAKWSLDPSETLGIVFWTKHPGNLVADRDRLKAYRVKIHLTVTGWSEVEKGAPTLTEGAYWLGETARAYGPENVTWRFTPVPIVPDAAERFSLVAAAAGAAGVRKCFVAFLQENDLLSETRSIEERRDLLVRFAEIAEPHRVQVLLCQDDRTLLTEPLHPNLDLGICAPPEDFPGSSTEVDTCGCSYSVDPFTVNESCVYGCSYCYAADGSTANKKRNTARLPIVRTR